MLTLLSLVGLALLMALFWKAMIYAQTYIKDVNEPGYRRRNDEE